jgi:hypothetical protein
VIFKPDYLNLSNKKKKRKGEIEVVRREYKLYFEILLKV